MASCITASVVVRCTRNATHQPPYAGGLRWDARTHARACRTTNQIVCRSQSPGKPQNAKTRICVQIHVYRTRLLYASTISVYHTHLPYASTIRVYHTRLPYASNHTRLTIRVYHTRLPYASTIRVYHTRLPYASIRVRDPTKPRNRLFFVFIWFLLVKITD